ncbi:MAG: hypothetical protein EWV84_16980, partial [Microcystis sp. M_QC_C_20170808_M3Col]
MVEQPRFVKQQATQSIFPQCFKTWQLLVDFDFLPRAVSFSHQNIKSKSDHCLCKMKSARQLLKYMLSLIEKLKQVKDFRKDKGKRHPLWIVLVVIIL